MRFRDLFTMSLVVGTVILFWLFQESIFDGTLFASKEINREDANRESTTLLNTDDWVEFQIVPNANNLRLLTNAALKSTDAPDHDLSNPRTGWRYSVEYELLDSQRNLITRSDYHFRSQIRQLLDVETGESIYPLFFGKSSLVSSQTRVMQISLNQKNKTASILRVKLKSRDEQIKEVVARVVARIQRDDYNDRTTWNRLSKPSRERICKYCVYDHDLLTVNERNNLMRWQWTRCPTHGEFEQRFLFFIGELNDLEIREQQIPAGMLLEPDWLSTLPIPNGEGSIRLEFERIDLDQSEGLVTTLRYFGRGMENRQSLVHRTGEQNSELKFHVDAGLVEFETNQRVVVRAYWTPDVGTEIPQLLRDGKMETGNESEFKITPDSKYVRTFLADKTPLVFPISHDRDKPTPFRVSLRYPMVKFFENGAVNISNEENLSKLSANWEFLNEHGEMIKTGALKINPIVSKYDRLSVGGKSQLTSEPANYFFSVPPEVASIRFSSQHRILVAGYVRPAELKTVTRIPEDYSAFCRKGATNRSWYGTRPIGYQALIRDNRSFFVKSNARPPKTNDYFAEGNYEWFRFQPKGNWIARQMLIPRNSDMEIREQSVNSVYFEVTEQAVHPYKTPADRPLELRAKVLVVADSAPGLVVIRQNEKVVFQKRILSSRAEIDLDEIDIHRDGTIQISAEQPARFFVRGMHFDSAPQFLRRTAQRLDDGKLEFEYEKHSQDEEILTMCIYRRRTERERCNVRVNIQPTNPQMQNDGPTESWTIRNRVYDLQAVTENPTVLIGINDKTDMGHRCYLRLGSELPPGKYTINVERTDPVRDGYVVLYQTVEGRNNRSIKVQQNRVVSR